MDAELKEKVLEIEIDAIRSLVARRMPTIIFLGEQGYDPANNFMTLLDDLGLLPTDEEIALAAIAQKQEGG